MSDQNLLKKGPNTNGKDVRVAMASDGSFLVAYTPYGSDFSLDLSRLNGDQLEMSWFHPATGKSIEVGEIEKSATLDFDPPADEGRGNDWVLLIKTQ